MNTPHGHQRHVARRLGSPLLAALVLGACAGSEPTTGADASPVEFTLRTVNGRSVPFAHGAAPGHQAIETLSGSLRFERLGSAWGRVVQREVSRVTDPGQAPVETAREVEGHAWRRGDTVLVARRNGSQEMFLLEDGVRRLRTIAGGSCVNTPGYVCPDILRVLVFERVP